MPPKSEIKSRSNRLLAQSRLQVTRCAIEICCLLHVVIQGPMSFRDRTIFLCDVRLRSYGSSKFPNFRILAYFPHTKPPQKVPSGDQPTAQGLHRRMTTIFPCGSRRSKGVPTGSGVFLRLLVEELGTPQTCPNFSLYITNGYTHTECYVRHCASDLDQRCLKTRSSSSKNGCTSPPNIFAPTPKITPKTPFLGTF